MGQTCRQIVQIQTRIFIRLYYRKTFQWPGKACAMRHSPIKNGNVTSFFAMDAPRSLSDFYDHFRYEIGEYEIGEYK